MEIIKTSGELNKMELYNLTMGLTTSLAKYGEPIHPVKWCLYKDTNAKDGGEVEILAILDDAGHTLSTISDTFKRSFFAINDLYDGDITKVIIVAQAKEAKSGRTYIDCILVGEA